MMASALIFAARRGERMCPLTDTCPKQLLHRHGQARVDWHVEALAQRGLVNSVINTAWLGKQLETHFLADF